MREKIKKWQEEIERITERQKEMNQRSAKQIGQLRKKIQEAELLILREENQMIANAVRETYGEVTPESLEKFKKTMKGWMDEAPEPGQGDIRFDGPSC